MISKFESNLGAEFRELHKCSMCGKIKALAEFRRDQSKKGGRSNACKVCLNARQNAKKQGGPLPPTKKEWLRAKELKECERCGKIKPITEFNKRSLAHDGLASYCKMCCTIFQREYREQSAERYRASNRRCRQRYAKRHPKQIRESFRRYRASLKGKARAARANAHRRDCEQGTENTLTAMEWSQILEGQEYKCTMCGHPFSPALPPTRDHILPVSKGGGLVIDNVQALCRSCNSKKGVQ